MSVPILTIPESAYDIATYGRAPRARQSRLLSFLLKLTHGSAGVLLLLYVIGFFGLKPLLETKVDRHYEFLEFFRGKLRNLYLNLVGRVSYIPIVAINRNGKYYADAITQTESSDHDNDDDKLGQHGLLDRLQTLSTKLSECTSYLISEMPHYKTVDFTVKDLQNKADLLYFNHNELFTKESEGKKKNISLEIKNDIRSIKGLFMSGQA